MREGREPMAADLDLQLLSLIDVFRRAPARLLNSGHPCRRVLRNASAQVLGEHVEVPEGWSRGGRLPFLYHLCRALGLLGRDGDHLRVDGARSARYFMAPAPDRTRQRVRAFRHADTWTELADLDELEIEMGARARGQGGPDMDRAVIARGLVFDAVSRLPVGEWTSLNDLFEAIRQDSPELLFPRETGPYYPGVARRKGAMLRVARKSGWATVEGAFILRVLESLARLGCVMFKDEESGGRDELHVTVAGLYALDTGPRPEDRSLTGGELVVQPTFELVVIARCPDVSLIFELERFATRTGPAPGTTYVLEEASVYRAVREGLEIEEILDFLHGHAQQPLPEPVVFALSDWARRQERIKVWRRSALIEFPDASALENYLIAMDLKASEARRVGDRWILVPDGDRRSVTRCLGQNYFTDLDYGADLPACVQTDGEGVLTITGAVARLDVRSRLATFCDPTTTASGEEGWRVTSEGLQRAEKAGVSAGKILDTLDELVDGGVPPALRVLVDAAAGHVGRVGLGQVTALVAERPGDVDRLAELPDVAPHVLRVLPGGVAIIRRQGEEQVRAALQALGVEEDPGVLTRKGVIPLAPDALDANATAAATAGGAGPSANGAAPAKQPQANGGGNGHGTTMTRAEVKRLLTRAVSDGREAVIRYDPGARRPLQDLRVAPVRIETRNGVGYLHARQRGRQATRKFSLKFVQGVRLLGADNA